MSLSTTVIYDKRYLQVKREKTYAREKKRRAKKEIVVALHSYKFS